MTDGAKAIDFSITEDRKIVDLTDKSHSVYNQIKRGDIEGVKIGAGTHKRLAGVPFRITSKTTGESHIVAVSYTHLMILLRALPIRQQLWKN